MILVVSEDRSCNRVSIAQGITEKDFVEKYGDSSYIIVKDEDVPNVRFIKLNDRNIVVEDTEKLAELELNFNIVKAKELLSRTDFALLQDNPLSLDELQIQELIDFRKKLRDIKNSKVLAEKPTFLSAEI